MENPQYVVFNARIKIVTLELDTTSRQLSAKCYLLNHLMTEKQLTMSNGFLAENTTLTLQLSASDLAEGKAIDIVFFEGCKQMGKVSIKLSEFQNAKLRKFTMSNCFDSKAYMQAFLLLLQTRIRQPPQISPINPKQSSLSNSLCNIEMEYSKISEEDTHKQLLAAEPQMKRFHSQSAETQTYDIESLLTINSILQENNAALQKENEDLKLRLSRNEQSLQILQSTRNIENQYKKTIAQMKEEVERLKEGLRACQLQLEEKMTLILLKQQELLRANSSLDEMRQLSNKLTKELEKEREMRLNQSVKDLNIDQMVTELTRYSQAAKRYRNSSTSRVVKVPASKQELKIYSNKKHVSFAQQTVDSLSESKLI